MCRFSRKPSLLVHGVSQTCALSQQSNLSRSLSVRSSRGRCGAPRPSTRAAASASSPPPARRHKEGGGRAVARQGANQGDGNFAQICLLPISSSPTPYPCPFRTIPRCSAQAIHQSIRCLGLGYCTATKHEDSATPLGYSAARFLITVIIQQRDFSSW
jgi:hypothetical protein